MASVGRYTVLPFQMKACIGTPRGVPSYSTLFQRPDQRARRCNMAKQFWLGVIIVTQLGGVMALETEAQTVWFVNGALETNGNGQSWGTAFGKIGTVT